MPTLLLLYWVRPQQIAKHALRRYIRGTIEREYFFDFQKFRTDSTVHAENFLLDDGGNRHGVEAIGEYLPKFERELSLAWII